MGYKLPFLIETDLLVNHRGKFRLDAEKKFQWTKTVYTDANLSWRPKQGRELSEDLEYEISLMYSPAWCWSAGLMFTDHTIGAGAQVRF